MPAKPGSADRIPRLTPKEAEFEMARVTAESQRAEIVRLNARIDRLKADNAELESENVKLEAALARATGERDVLARRLAKMTR
jgi:hypothetical protein